MKNCKKLCKIVLLTLILSIIAAYNPVNATSNNSTTANSGFFSVFFNKLSKVSDLKSEINGTNVNLKWKKISNAYGYEILINNPKIGNITLNASLNSLSISGFPVLEDNYTVKVRAYKMSGNSKVYGEYSDSIEFKIESDSKEDEETPKDEEQTSEDETSISKIDNVTPQLDGDTVQLNWSEDDNADGYELVLGIPGIGDLPLESDTSSKFIKGLSVAEGDYSVKVRGYKTIASTKVYGEYSDPINFNYTAATTELAANPYSTTLISNRRDADAMKNNTYALQNLINNASNNGGGTVTIPAGTFYFAALSSNYDKSGDNGSRRIIECKSNVTIKGAGQNQTILMPVSDGGFINNPGAEKLPVDMFYYSYSLAIPEGSPLVNVHFSDFTIDSINNKGAIYNAKGKRIYDFLL